MDKQLLAVMCSTNTFSSLILSLGKIPPVSFLNLELS